MLKYDFGLSSKNCIVNALLDRSSVVVNEIRPEQDNMCRVRNTNGNYIPRHTEVYYTIECVEDINKKPVVIKELYDINSSIQHFVCLLFAKLNIDQIIENREYLQYGNYLLYSRGLNKASIFLSEEAESYVHFHLYNIFRRVKRDKWVLYTDYGVIRP